MFDDFPLKPYLEDEKIKVLAKKAIDIFDFANNLRKNKMAGQKISPQDADEFNRKIENFRISLRGFKDTEYENYIPAADDDFENIFRFIEELAINTLYKI